MRESRVVYWVVCVREKAEKIVIESVGEVVVVGGTARGGEVDGCTILLERGMERQRGSRTRGEGSTAPGQTGRRSASRLRTHQTSTLVATCYNVGLVRSEREGMTAAEAAEIGIRDRMLSSSRSSSTGPGPRPGQLQGRGPDTRTVLFMHRTGLCSRRRRDVGTRVSLWRWMEVGVRFVVS